MEISTKRTKALSQHDVMMREEGIFKLLIQFAAPSLAGMLAGAIYNMVDRIFVGHFVGSIGLAAITTTFPPMILLFAFSLLYGIGGSSRIAILRGAQRQKQAEHVLGQSIAMLIITGVIAIAIGIPFANPILRLTGTSDAVMPSAITYMRIIMLGAPFALLSVAFSSLIRACGAPRYAMWTQIIGAGANVVLDALFILHFKIGVAGAAWGTVCAQMLATALGFGYFATKSATLKIRLPFMLHIKLNVLRRIISVGIAPFLVEITFLVYITCMNRLMYTYSGDMGLSAVGVFFSIDSLLFLPAFSIGDAAQPIIGYNYGANLPKRAVEVIKRSLLLIVSFYVITSLSAEIFAEYLVRMFSTDPELIELAVPGMRLAYVGLPFFGVIIVTNAALQALGHARESVILSACRQLLFMFPPLFIFPIYFGVWGIWGAYPVGDVMGAIVASYFLRKTIKWLNDPQCYFVER